ncbi:MAG: putative peptide zinc metalloprotease protein, partial [Acidimicrobiia bacterium]|nr:putative peptide zinc metalloprotease protein [Acidimicrobiia bacterium]
AAAVYSATGSAPLLALIVLTQFQALYQLLPFVRLDGYYILGDLIGIPNLFAYLRAAAASLLPVAPATRRDAERTMANLTSRTRLAVRVWVALTVPVLALNLGVVAILAPRVLPAYLDSARSLVRTLVHAVGGGDWIAGLNAIFQLLFLIIPVLGWAVLGATTLLALRRPLVRVAVAVGRAARRPVPAGGLVAVALAGAALVAAVWLMGSGASPSSPAGPTGSAATGEIVAEPDMGRQPAQTPPSVGESPAASAATTVATVSAPPASAVPAQIGPTGTGQTGTPGAASSWTVQPGDDLWSVAEETLTGFLGRPSTEDETLSYWTAVMAENAPMINDPNLLHVGQLIALPAVTEPAESQSTAEAASQATVPDTGLEPTRPPASLQDSTGSILPTPVAQGAWTVRAGDHLWLVADQVMTRALGRPSTQAETTSYWQALVGSNSTTLADPNFLHPGERLTLPALARTDGQPSGAPRADDPSD